jgi:hypothetical protein
MTNRAATIPRIAAVLHFSRGEWLAAWRGITREQAIGAALLGFAAVAPTLLQMTFGPFDVPAATLRA